MTFITDPLYVSTALLLLVGLSDWLSRKRYFRAVGSALTVIILGAILANVGLIPSSSNAPALYSGIFSYVAPIAIFFLLLDVKLRDLRKAGTMMLLLFLLGCACVVAGTIIGFHLLAPGSYGIEKPHAIAGMIASTYTGGSVNLAAVALHYGMTADGTLFAAINAADNIITTLWIIVTMVIPVVLQRRWPRGTPSVAAPVTAVIAPESTVQKEEVVLLDLVILLAMGTGSLFAAQLLSRYLPGLPAILTLTTVALVLAQVPFVQRLQGARALASLTVLLFLAVIGANCDIAALLMNGQIAAMLLAWVTIAVVLHGVFLFGIGALFRRDWAMLSVVSNAGVGGATTAGVLATAIRRDDLRLPGVLVGAVGNAIGTYIGIFLAEFLK